MKSVSIANLGLVALLGTSAAAQGGGATAQAGGGTPSQASESAEFARSLVAKLELESYKATVKGLTQFGDRRQGTDRNRAALDWIEAQLKSYGCTNTERMQYDYSPAPAQGRGGGGGGGRGAAAGAGAAGGGGRGGSTQIQVGATRTRGNRGRTGVNNDSLAQPDARLRALNAQPSEPGLREQVWCTKVGTTRPDEMYIISGHMDGIGWGEAANDDGSGTALVMELARILSAPDVQTERSIRFALWNNEESGLNGARAYIEQRQALQGIEQPAGSRKFPEPKWLGVIQHDMLMFDHGMPRPDGSIPPEQRPEADVNVEFQMNSRMAAESQKLAWFLHGANVRFATDHPATVGPNMSNTDSVPFQDIIPSVSVRENERTAHIGAGWNPHWHQATDVFSTFSDADFRLALNAAQMTLGALTELAGVTKK